MLADIIEKWGGHEVIPMEVYRTMFHFGEGYLQKENEKPGQYKANPIVYWKNEKESKGHYRILFEDTFEQTLAEAQRADFAITNGLTYFGRKNLQTHASKMFAMIFDLDGVNDITLNRFFSGVSVDAYPMPNYVILSGHGVHLYYLFEEPVPLFPNIKLQVKNLKYALTDRIWNPNTSIYKTRQRQGINQGFRVIGGRTKSDATERITRAFETSSHPVSLTQLSRYVPDDVKVDESKLFRESKITLAQAKEKYPEWYQRVVVEKDDYHKRWEIEKKVHGDNPYALYDWWKNQIADGATYTHRYFCVMCLAIYGAKCNVPYDKVKQDAYDMIPYLDGLKPDHPFTKSDVDSALECYDWRYCTFPITDISKLSDIPIKKNRRNGRKQAVHLGRIRAMQNYDDPEGNWRNKKGRPAKSGTKRHLVAKYFSNHPNATVSQAAKDLGISRTTIYKFRDAREYEYFVDLGLPSEDSKNIAVVSERPLDIDEAKRLAAYQMRMKLLKEIDKKNQKRSAWEN